MEDIGNQVKKGAGWMMLGKLVTRSLGLISTIILARILAPSDFGLLAMATAVAVFLELLSSFGFDSVLIQNRDAERYHYDTAWTFKIGIGIIVAAGMFLLAVPAAIAFNDPRLVNVIRVLSLAPLIGGFENIGIVNFRKELAFHREFGYSVATKLCSFVATVTSVILLQNYWALVIGTVVGRSCDVAISYLVHPYRPRLSLRARGQLLDFSKWILLNNFVGYFYRQSADVIVGAMSGAQAVGLFRMSFEISNMPTAELIAPLNRVIFPGYAQVAGDRARLRRGFLKTISLIALVAVPAAVGIAATADLLVPAVLGPKWAAAIPIVQLLALFGVISSLESNTFYVQLALGNVRRFTFLMGLSSALLVVLIASLTHVAGAVGAAWAYLIVSTAFFPLFFSVVMRLLDIDVRSLVQALMRPAVSSGVMYVVVRLAARMAEPTSSAGQWAWLLAVVSVGGGTYIASVMILWLAASKPAGAEEYVLSTIGEVLRGRRPPAIAESAADVSLDSTT
jgi:lipopolysaccharide exporter